MFPSFPRDRQLHGAECIKHKPTASPHAGEPYYLRQREISFAQVR
jgi:hypothetical protein